MIKIGDDGRELLLGLLVEVGDRNTGCKDGIVGVCNSHVCCSLGGLRSKD